MELGNLSLQKTKPKVILKPGVRKHRFVYLRQSVKLTSRAQVISRSQTTPRIVCGSTDVSVGDADSCNASLDPLSSSSTLSTPVTSESKLSPIKAVPDVPGSDGGNQSRTTPADPLRGLAFLEPLGASIVTDKLVTAGCPLPNTSLYANSSFVQLGFSRGAYSSLRSALKLREHRWIHFSIPWSVARLDGSKKDSWLKILTQGISSLCVVCVRAGTYFTIEAGVAAKIWDLHCWDRLLRGHHVTTCVSGAGTKERRSSKWITNAPWIMAACMGDNEKFIDTVVDEY